MGERERERERSEMEASLAMVLLFVFFLIAPPLASPSCHETCGHISIPHPFGIQSHCALSPHCLISCKENSSFGIGPLPFLTTTTGDFQVLSFSSDSLIINSTYFKASSSDSSFPNSSTLQLPDPGPYSLAPDNFFVAVGCNYTGVLSMPNASVMSCRNPACHNVQNASFCNNFPCCLLGFGGRARSITIRGAGDNYGFSTAFNLHTYARTSSAAIGAGHYGLKLSWGFPSSVVCPACARRSSHCVQVDSYTPARYVCNCSQGYRGDGYENGTGCTDIDECAEEHLNNCVPAPQGRCTNTPGSFCCSCSIGQGDGIREASGGKGCKQSNQSKNTILIITGAAVSTAVAILVIGFIVWRVLELRESKVNKAKHFENNGGLRLREYISSAEGRETPRLFSEDELKKATQNFAEHLKLGTGGYGTVYKGILQDMTVVAVKRSNHSEQQEADQFINEVIILSQINHRNIVQLLGCCLETRAPLLVYEYIPNGTLSEYLQGKDGRFLSWESRLTIAFETARALAYLHSSMCTPIFHRDIKSSNILVDRTLTPKVSDFGISRLVPMDETHVSTVVQGTMGYLDPEYFQTFQLTEKSDVYSFGVVLLELITSLKPVSVERGDDERNLAMLCISRVRTGTFSSLIDPTLKASEDASVMGSINQVANLAMNCLRVEGHSRPSMKQIFEQLLWMRVSKQAVSGDVYSAAVDYVDEVGDEDERRALIDSADEFLSEASTSTTTTRDEDDEFSYGRRMAGKNLVLELMMMGGSLTEEGR